MAHQSNALTVSCDDTGTPSDATVAVVGTDLILDSTLGDNPGTVVLDLTAAANDTLGELVAVIEALPAWTATLLGSAGTASTLLNQRPEVNALAPAVVTLAITVADVDPVHGERPIPIREFPDEAGLLVMGPIASGAGMLTANQVMWWPERTVVIDAIRATNLTGTADTTDYQWFKGVGPFGAAPADADVDAVVGAARAVTNNLTTSITQAASPVSFVIPADAHNVIRGAGERTDGRRECLALAPTNVGGAGGLVVFEVRYRSKRR